VEEANFVASSSVLLNGTRGLGQPNVDPEVECRMSQPQASRGAIVLS